MANKIQYNFKYIKKYNHSISHDGNDSNQKALAKTALWKRNQKFSNLVSRLDKSSLLSVKDRSGRAR